MSKDRMLPVESFIMERLEGGGWNVIERRADLTDIPIADFVSRRDAEEWMRCRDARFMRQRRAPLTKRFISGSSSNQPACLGTKRELCSLYVLKTGGGDVAGFCRGSSGFGVDRAVCRDDRDMGPGDPHSVSPNL